MSAMRLARAVTGRDADPQVRRRLPRPRRRAARRGRLRPRDAGDPGVSPGVPAAQAARHRDRALERPRCGRAAVATRTTRGDPRRAGARRTWASSRPTDGFLELPARAADDRRGALLIFDEVITGFRVARGGAQERYGVTPDLTIIGKIIGGGLPAAAYGGPPRADGADRARRRRLPGGHAVGQPARRGRRAGDAAPARRRRLRAAGARPPRRSPTGCATRRPTPASAVQVQSLPGPAHRRSSPTSPVRDYDGRRGVRHRGATAPSAGRCWRAASTRRRRSSRPGSRRWRTRRRARRGDPERRRSGIRRAVSALAEVARPADPGLADHVVADPPRRAVRPLGPDRGFVLEAVREGYELHYGEPRVFTGMDRGPAPAAGDALYALGLARLAELGDLDAIAELADLISLLRAGPRRGRAPERVPALWARAERVPGR